MVASALAVSAASPGATNAGENRRATSTTHGTSAIALATGTAHADDAPPYRRTDRLLYAATGLGALHLTDNVLSGRSFAGHLPSTLTQPLYLMLPLSIALDAGPLFTTTMSTAFLIAHATGHYVMPSSANYLPTFHDRWTDRSNRLDISSGGLGRVSQGTLIMLDLTLVAVLASSILDGVEHGFTLRKWSPGNLGARK